MDTFWSRLPKPFTVLAPMENVTDVVFRGIVCDVARPDVFFTEFTNVEGLLSSGRKRVEENFLFDPREQPIVAQIWGTNPESFEKVARRVVALGFSGIDINMGCPVRTIIKQGACSALIRTPQLATEIIEATRAGAGNLPVSVKTRIGFTVPIIEEWLGFLLKQNLAAITVHLRTVAEQSTCPAHWELMPEVLQLRDTISPETVVIGNGGILSLDEVSQKYKEYQNEGFMIGTGIFSNPWVFDSKNKKGTTQQRIDLYHEHIQRFANVWLGKKNPALIKKFCKMYISGFDGASEYREKLMQTTSLEELQSLLEHATFKEQFG